MSIPSITPRRLLPGDVLAQMHLELVRAGLQLKPWQADERACWVRRCRQLLDCVPDPIQRWAWCAMLAQSCMSFDGMPLALRMGYLQRETP